MGILKKAENRMAYAKIGLYGDAGSGKTFTAAKFAIELHKYAKLKKPVAMFDTEPAASFIMPHFEKAGIEFLVADESRSLADLMTFMKEAEESCSIAIIDSITHVWREVQKAQLKAINEKRKQKRMSPIFQLEFHHWRNIKEKFAMFTDKFLSSRLHCIVCGRAGSIYEYQENDQGKKELITTGTKMASEKEMGYEPSLLIEMSKILTDKGIINRAFVEKDRSDLINGKTFDYPSFGDIKPHIDFLNIGGEHFGSMDDRDSSEMFEEESDEGFSNEKRQREIWCEEIKALFVSHGLDGSTKDDKKKRGDFIMKHFGTGSWTRIESMQSLRIKEGYFRMKTELETPEVDEAGEPPPDVMDTLPRVENE